MRQIVLVQSKGFRLGFVNSLHENKDVKATDALVNRAVFDVDLEVRHIAVALLRERPKADYVPALKKALRYPWLPVVRNAIDAAISLKLNELVPDLAALLDEPDPEAPYAVTGKGPAKHMVRELVRINHHRNCMLCHVPSANPSAGVKVDAPPKPVRAPLVVIEPGTMISRLLPRPLIEA